jgi:hypothetical protein
MTITEQTKNDATLTLEDKEDEIVITDGDKNDATLTEETKN